MIEGPTEMQLERFASLLLSTSDPKVCRPAAECFVSRQACRTTRRGVDRSEYIAIGFASCKRGPGGEMSLRMLDDVSSSVPLDRRRPLTLAPSPRSWGC